MGPQRPGIWFQPYCQTALWSQAKHPSKPMALHLEEMEELTQHGSTDEEEPAGGL
jgi:hypothetical protein